MIRISEDELRSQLAKGVHTAFRKATDCPQAMPIWKLIREMPEGEWGRTIDWVVWAIALNYTEQPGAGRNEDMNDSPVNWTGRRFGQLTPAEKHAAAKDAGRKLSAELAANADAISAILDQDFRPIMPTPIRPLSEIAEEITDSWARPYFGAVPYIQAMLTLNKITDYYGAESAAEIVQYFLSNARTWRGRTAQRIKAELKGMIK